MADIALGMHHVYKRFRKGQLHDSLRDLIPALARRLVGRRDDAPLSQREFWAVRDVSFEVQRGEAFGVIGPNGAGKSTILKLLTGIMRPTQGTLAIQGRLSALIEVSAGFHPELTGRENIYLNGTIIGMTRREIAARFDEIVAFSGLEEFIDTPVKRYSSGMFARLGFSVAAHVDPDILIVDEVLSVGDYVFQRKCIDRMNAIIQRGATVIFVSHNLRAVADLCDRALLLDHGQAVALGPTDEVIRAYLERAEAQRAPERDAGVFVSRVEVLGASGRRAHYIAGEPVTVEVDVVSRGRFERLAAVIDLRDAKEYEVFHASSEALTGTAFSIGPDEAVTCRFTLQLHLGPGRYQLATWVHRFDTRQTYDHWPSAATILVSDERHARGVANLYPTVEVSPPRAAPRARGASAASEAGSGRRSA
jgi:lipopolysaccharide transport system ATP-binding protein